MGSEDEKSVCASLFEDESKFYAAPVRPTEKILEYKIPSTGETLPVRVVGHHVLWANYIWNGAKWLSDYIDGHKREFVNRRILELGAGAGVPSLMAVKAGAELVVTTDYPDEELITNIRKNIVNILSVNEREHILAIGYLWGSDERSVVEANEGRLFDMVFMCDVIFNHSEHRALLKTIDRCLRRDDQGVAWCVFSHYRPLLKDRDLDLLRLAESEFGFIVEKVDELRYNELVVECNRGDPEDTCVVYAYIIKRRL